MKLPSGIEASRILCVGAGHRDSMLLAEITDREVGKRSVVDEAGLKAYLRRTVRTSIGTNRVIRVLCCIVLPSGWRSKYGNF